MIVAPEMASSAVRFFERVTQAPTMGALGRVGLNADEVRRLANRAQPLTAEQTRRALAKMTRCGRNNWGRRGLPEHVVRAMYADYTAGKSCAEVAAIYGGTRQSVFDVFKSHGLPMRPRHQYFHAKVMHDGVAYTPGKDGYLRATNRGRRPLHYVLWEAAHGPVPAGYNLRFKDGDRAHCTLDNLECLPKPVVVSLQGKRQNQYTKARGAEGKAA